jgi:hypothetical protein
MAAHVGNVDAIQGLVYSGYALWVLSRGTGKIEVRALRLAAGCRGSAHVC